MPLTQVSSRSIEDTLRYVLGASGTNHYTFTGKGLTGAVNDPTLTLSRGHTYIFENRNSANAHPFYIKTSIANGGTNDQYSTGVTNNCGAGGTEIVFTVPHDSPDLLYYQCSSHSIMAGQLNIVGAVTDGSITTAKIADSAVTNGKLATDAVTTAKVANSAITNSKLGDDCVTGSRIADDAINSEHYVDGSIDTAHIADSAVTAAKINNGAVTNAKIDTMAASKLTGDLPAISGANLTGIQGIPSGVIMLWSGAANAIPSGFVLCDGNNSTPNLQDRFVVGAGSSYNVNSTGGADSVTLSTTQIPSHSHTTPNHNHSFSGSGSSSHNHGITVYNSGNYSSKPFGYHGQAQGTSTQNTQNATVSLTVSGNTGYHSGTTTATGSGSSHENRPPYYALCYIMKT